MDVGQKKKIVPPILIEFFAKDIADFIIFSYLIFS